MFLRFLPPAFGVVARRLLLRGHCSSQSAAAAPAGTSPPAMTRRLLTMMMKPQSHESKLHGMAAAAALSAAVGGGAWWYTSSKINKEDNDLSRMRRRVKEWIRGEIYRPADRSRSCDSGCDDTYRGFMAAMENAHDGGAVQSLRRPSSSSEKEVGGGGGGCVSPAPARRFGFLGRFFFWRPPSPSEVDWVEAGAVSRVVRRQKNCGSCWAMATVGSVEAAHYLKTKEQISLSVQELIDCDSKSHGCNGGKEWDALDYIEENGLSTESAYPYTAEVSPLGCEEKKTPATRISGWEMMVFPTERALERAVAKRPVVVSLQNCDELQRYKGGIMEYRALPYTLPDGSEPDWHVVLMVGYGTDANGVEYWRFKNSWGEGWGEKGFGRIRRRHGGWRGVAGLRMLPAVYPIIE